MRLRDHKLKTIRSYPYGEAPRLSTMHQHVECDLLLCHQITLLITIVPPFVSCPFEVIPLTLASGVQALRS